MSTRPIIKKNEEMRNDVDRVSNFLSVRKAPTALVKGRQSLLVKDISRLSLMNKKPIIIKKIVTKEE